MIADVTSSLPFTEVQRTERGHLVTENQGSSA